MSHVQTSIYHVQHMHTHIQHSTYCIFIHVCVQTCLDLVHSMYILCTDIKCKNSFVYEQSHGMQKIAYMGI